LFLKIFITLKSNSTNINIIYIYVYRKIKQRIFPVLSIFIFINTILTIIIIVKRKTKIITDTGLYSSIIFSVGVIMVFCGPLFYLNFTIDNNIGCFMNSFLTHIGFILIYTQYLYKAIVNTQYGINTTKAKHRDKLKMIFNLEKSLLELILKTSTQNSSSIINCKSSGSEELLENDTLNNNHKKYSMNTLNLIDEINMIQCEDQKNFMDNFLSDNKLNEQNSLDNISSSSNYKNIREYVKKRKYNISEKMFSHVVQTFRFNIILIIFYILVYIINALFIKDIEWKKELVNNEFIFNCQYGNTELFLTTVENLLVVFLIYKIRKIFKFSLVLKEIRLLTFTVYMWVFIGPLVDVIIINIYIYIIYQ